MKFLERFNRYFRIRVGLRRCLVLLFVTSLLLSVHIQALGAHPETGGGSKKTAEDSEEVLLTEEEAVANKETGSDREESAEDASETQAVGEESGSSEQETEGKKDSALTVSQVDMISEEAAGAEDVPAAAKELAREKKDWVPPTNISQILGEGANWPTEYQTGRGVLSDSGAKPEGDAAQVSALELALEKDSSVMINRCSDIDGVSYIGRDSNGRLLFTADAAGNITYMGAPKLYYDEKEGLFYSDSYKIAPLTDIEGILDCCDLALPGESIITLLNVVDGTLATVEIPKSQVLSKEEGKKEKKHTYYIWKAEKKDEDYAPSFARYICSDKKGEIQFYADKMGRIFYNEGQKAVCNGKYFYTLKKTGKKKYAKSELITKYQKLGIRYPEVGNHVRFVMDGKAYEVSLYDIREGAKGRYICRNVTKESKDPQLIRERQKVGGVVPLNDKSVVCMMDEFGNILYAEDDYEWEYVDEDIDYGLMAIMVADGTQKRLNGEYNNYGMLDNQHHLPEQEEEEAKLKELEEAQIKALEEAEQKAVLDAENKAIKQQEKEQKKQAKQIQKAHSEEVLLSEEEIAKQNAKKAKKEEALQAEMLQNEAMQTEAAQTEMPQGEIQQEQVPQQEIGQGEAVQTEVSQNADPQQGVAQTEAAQAEVPQAEAPQTKAPKEIDGLTQEDFGDKESWEEFAKGSHKEVDMEKEVDGLTRADFGDDESWENFLKGE